MGNWTLDIAIVRLFEVGRYVSSVNFDLKSSRVEESDENNHSDAADNFSLNDFRSFSELTCWKRSSSRKSRDR